MDTTIKESLENGDNLEAIARAKSLIHTDKAFEEITQYLAENWVPNIESFEKEIPILDALPELYRNQIAKTCRVNFIARGRYDDFIAVTEYQNDEPTLGERRKIANKVASFYLEDKGGYLDSALKALEGVPSEFESKMLLNLFAKSLGRKRNDQVLRLVERIRSKNLDSRAMQVFEIHLKEFLPDH